MQRKDPAASVAEKTLRSDDFSRLERFREVRDGFERAAVSHNADFTTLAGNTMRQLRHSVIDSTKEFVNNVKEGNTPHALEVARNFTRMSGEMARGLRDTSINAFKTLSTDPNPPEKPSQESFKSTTGKSEKTRSKSQASKKSSVKSKEKPPSQETDESEEDTEQAIRKLDSITSKHSDEYMQEEIGNPENTRKRPQSDKQLRLKSSSSTIPDYPPPAPQTKPPKQSLPPPPSNTVMPMPGFYPPPMPQQPQYPRRSSGGSRRRGSSTPSQRQSQLPPPPSLPPFLPLPVLPYIPFESLARQAQPPMYNDHQNQGVLRMTAFQQLQKSAADYQRKTPSETKSKSKVSKSWVEKKIYCKLLDMMVLDQWTKKHADLSRCCVQSENRCCQPTGLRGNGKCPPSDYSKRYQQHTTCDESRCLGDGSKRTIQIVVTRKNKKHHSSGKPFCLDLDVDKLKELIDSDQRVTPMSVRHNKQEDITLTDGSSHCSSGDEHVLKVEADINTFCEAFSTFKRGIEETQTKQNPDQPSVSNNCVAKDVATSLKNIKENIKSSRNRMEHLIARNEERANLRMASPEARKLKKANRPDQTSTTEDCTCDCGYREWHRDRSCFDSKNNVDHHTSLSFEACKPLPRTRQWENHRSERYDRYDRCCGQLPPKYFSNRQYDNRCNQQDSARHTFYPIPSTNNKPVSSCLKKGTSSSDIGTHKTSMAKLCRRYVDFDIPNEEGKRVSSKANSVILGNDQKGEYIDFLEDRDTTSNHTRFRGNRVLDRNQNRFQSSPRGVRHSKASNSNSKRNAKETELDRYLKVFDDSVYSPELQNDSAHGSISCPMNKSGGKGCQERCETHNKIYHQLYDLQPGYMDYDIRVASEINRDSLGSLIYNSSVGKENGNEPKALTSHVESDDGCYTPRSISTISKDPSSYITQSSLHLKDKTGKENIFYRSKRRTDETGKASVQESSSFQIQCENRKCKCKSKHISKLLKGKGSLDSSLCTTQTSQHSKSKREDEEGNTLCIATTSISRQTASTSLQPSNRKMPEDKKLDSHAIHHLRRNEKRSNRTHISGKGLSKQGKRRHGVVQRYGNESVSNNSTELENSSLKALCSMTNVRIDTQISCMKPELDKHDVESTGTRSCTSGSVSANNMSCNKHARHHLTRETNGKSSDMKREKIFLNKQLKCNKRSGRDDTQIMSHKKLEEQHVNQKCYSKQRNTNHCETYQPPSTNSNSDSCLSLSADQELGKDSDKCDISTPITTLIDTDRDVKERCSKPQDKVNRCETKAPRSAFSDITLSLDTNRQIADKSKGSASASVQKSNIMAKNYIDYKQEQQQEFSKSGRNECSSKEYAGACTDRCPEKTSSDTSCSLELSTDSTASSRHCEDSSRDRCEDEEKNLCKNDSSTNTDVKNSYSSCSTEPEHKHSSQKRSKSSSLSPGQIPTKNKCVGEYRRKNRSKPNKSNAGSSSGSCYTQKEPMKNPARAGCQDKRGNNDQNDCCVVKKSCICFERKICRENGKRKDSSYSLPCQVPSNEFGHEEDNKTDPCKKSESSQGGNSAGVFKERKRESCGQKKQRNYENKKNLCTEEKCDSRGTVCRENEWTEKQNDKKSSSCQYFQSSASKSDNYGRKENAYYECKSPICPFRKRCRLCPEYRCSCFTCRQSLCDNRESYCKLYCEKERLKLNCSRTPVECRLLNPLPPIRCPITACRCSWGHCCYPSNTDQCCYPGFRDRPRCAYYKPRSKFEQLCSSLQAFSHDISEKQKAGVLGRSNRAQKYLSRSPTSTPQNGVNVTPSSSSSSFTCQCSSTSGSSENESKPQKEDQSQRRVKILLKFQQKKSKDLFAQIDQKCSALRNRIKLYTVLNSLKKSKAKRKKNFEL